MTALGSLIGTVQRQGNTMIVLTAGCVPTSSKWHQLAGQHVTPGRTPAACEQNSSGVRFF